MLSNVDTITLLGYNRIVTYVDSAVNTNHKSRHWRDVDLKICRYKLAVALIKRDLNTVQLAARTGLSRETISAVKNGKRCSDRTAILIADCLGMSVKELLEEGV